MTIRTIADFADEYDATLWREEVRDLLSPVYETTITTDAQTIDVSGLDGNAHGGYHIEVFPYNAAGSGCAYYMYVNEDYTATDYRSIYQEFTPGASPTTSTGYFNDGNICYATANVETVYATIDISQVYNTNDTRYDIRANILNNARKGGTNLVGAQRAWLYDDANAANLTSIRFHAEKADGFGVGSVIRVWRKR